MVDKSPTLYYFLPDWTKYPPKPAKKRAFFVPNRPRRLKHHQHTYR